MNCIIGVVVTNRFYRIWYDYVTGIEAITLIAPVPMKSPWSKWGNLHDDVFKRKHFPRYWPFVRGISRSPVNSSNKGQWHEALTFSVNCSWINGWVNNGEAGDLRRHRAHYDVIVMSYESQGANGIAATKQSKMKLFCIFWGAHCLMYHRGSNRS